MAQSDQKLNNLLMKVKEESEEVGLKLYTRKTEIMASCPITSWKIDAQTGKWWKTLFWGATKSPHIMTTAMKLKYAYSS